MAKHRGSLRRTILWIEPSRMAGMVLFTQTRTVEMPMGPERPGQDFLARWAFPLYSPKFSNNLSRQTITILSRIQNGLILVSASPLKLSSMTQCVAYLITDDYSPHEAPLVDVVLQCDQVRQHSVWCLSSNWVPRTHGFCDSTHALRMSWEICGIHSYVWHSLTNQLKAASLTPHREPGSVQRKPSHHHRELCLSVPKSGRGSALMFAEQNLKMERQYKCNCVILGLHFFPLTLFCSYDCNGTAAQRWLITHGRIQLAGTPFCLDAGPSAYCHLFMYILCSPWSPLLDPSIDTELIIWTCSPDIVLG